MPDSSGSPEHVRIGPASRPTGGTKWTCPHTTSPKAEPPKGALGPRAGRRRLGPRTPPSVPRREAPIGASRARNNRDTLPPDRGSSLALPGKVPKASHDECSGRALLRPSPAARRPIDASRARHRRRRRRPRTRPSEAPDRPRTASHRRAGPLTTSPHIPRRGHTLASPGKVPPVEFHQARFLSAWLRSRRESGRKSHQTCRPQCSKHSGQDTSL